MPFETLKGTFKLIWNFVRLILENRTLRNDLHDAQSSFDGACSKRARSNLSWNMADHNDFSVNLLTWRFLEENLSLRFLIWESFQPKSLRHSPLSMEHRDSPV